MLDGDSLAVRGIQRLIHVVDILRVGIVEAVKLQDDVLGQTGSRGRNTTSGSQIDMIVVAHLFNVAHFEDSPVQRTIEAIAQLLCHVAQVQVVVGNLTHVHMLAEVWVRGVGGTIEDSLGVCQVTIGALSSRGTREDSHLELAAGLVLSHSNLCQFLGCCLSHTSGCKATHGDVLAILNQRRSLCGSHTCISHNLVKFANLPANLLLFSQTTKQTATFQLIYKYSINTSHTAMMWQMLPARTKKWNTECMKRLRCNE